MTKFFATLSLVGVAALAGCTGKTNPLDPTKPLDQMSQAELCAYYPVYISRTDISEESRTIATAKLSKMGCSAVSVTR